MTTEEAIHFAKCLKNNWTIDFNDMADFCDMAIEALTYQNLSKPNNTCEVDLSSEVVRCKDCRHYESDGGAFMVCSITDMVTDDDDFCSCGERREE